MMTEDMTVAQRLEQLEAIVACSEAERRAAQTLADRLETQRGMSLAELGKYPERREAEEIAERNRRHQERSDRYDAHIARVNPRSTGSWRRLRSSTRRRRSSGNGPRPP
jgi:hypothetical protein